jgi:hypothetical protein
MVRNNMDIKLGEFKRIDAEQSFTTESVDKFKGLQFRKYDTIKPKKNGWYLLKGVGYLNKNGEDILTDTPYELGFLQNGDWLNIFDIPSGICGMGYFHIIYWIPLSEIEEFVAGDDL